ncbi:hypothetical protein V2J09_020935 [Rumex salicifolius]
MEPAENSKLLPAKSPSLVDLCVQTAIDNIQYLGNVGEVETHLLDRILPHCTIEQLMHIENETEGRDLCQATDKLWKKFYEAIFGTQHTSDVVEKMKLCKRKFLWRQLYQAKLMVQREPKKPFLERLMQLHKKEDERRQQLRICVRAPTTARKRCVNAAGSNLPNAESKIMKKPKEECLDRYSNTLLRHSCQ